jgi:hypothetical protein
MTMTFNAAKAILVHACNVEPVVAQERLAPYAKNNRTRRAYVCGFLQAYTADYQGFEHLGPITPAIEPAWENGREEGLETAMLHVNG